MTGADSGREESDDDQQREGAQRAVPGDARHRRRQGQLLHEGVQRGEDEVRV